MPSLPLVVALLCTSCRTTEPAPPSTTTSASTTSAQQASLPDWLHAPSLARAPELEEAAALLCARDTDAVIDDDARHAAHVVDGQLVGLMRKAKDEAGAQAALAQDAAAVLAEKRVTHAGVAVGTTPSGEACAAVVGARRLVVLEEPPAARLGPGVTIDLALKLSGGRTTLYLLKPDGFVDRRELPDPCEGAELCNRTMSTKVSLPTILEGRYVAEIVVDNGGGLSDPEVALLWPVVVGKPKTPPFPEVLFPDTGHDDTALTHRAEALVQRLRNEQLIEPFKVSPALVDVAVDRSKRVADRGYVNHRVPAPGESARGAGGTDAAQDLRARFGAEPRAQFVKLAEVQAQASTLADAWQALLDSPAHRYVLVDTAFTHCGVAVARGKDAAGRPTVTMVALLARRPPSRDPDETRATIIEAANDARDKRGLQPLVENQHLNRIATRLAGAMRDAKKVDETLLGGTVAKVALEADASMTKVKPLVAKTDDPLLLLAKQIPPLLMELDATKAGAGIALDASEGVFYVVILAGE